MRRNTYAMYEARDVACGFGYLHASLRAVVTCLTLALVGGCMAQESITSWSSPRLVEVKKQWDAQAAITTQDKSEWQRIQGKLHGILKSSLSHDDLRNLAATAATLGVHSEDRSDFENALLVYLQTTLAASGDRDNLVKLLSTRCELRIGMYVNLEHDLASRGETLRDPILVLGEAFSRCQVPEVRRDLAGAVRRAFLGHGILGKDDPEYVNNAMQWYQEQKDHLTVNELYSNNTVHYPTEAFDQSPDLYERLETAPAEKRPTSNKLYSQWYERNQFKWMRLFEKTNTRE